MRLLTYRDESGDHVGVVRGEEVIDLSVVEEYPPADILSLIDRGDTYFQHLASMMSAIKSSERAKPLSSLHVLPPLNPPRENVICVGRNYVEHAEEMARARERDVTPPTVFTKAQTSINGPYGDVPIFPSISTQVDWEAELGVVIGRRGMNIPAEHALDYVFGYTVVNDVSARDIQYGWGGQFFKGKSMDGSCPIGPWIVTRDDIPDPQALSLRLRINGETKQDGNTRDMIRPVADLIAWVSEGMTLLPGNLIATGTPAGVGQARTPPEFLKPGDVMETEVQGIGVMRNRVVSA
jgi:2-keto-4-pentenoate hydratase/2-oxohepta-3-ene-1,7-dioic acid hydratase in catechol pathway